MTDHLLIPLGSTNVYALVDDARALLIDAGPDYQGAWEELVAALAAHGITPADVQAVILTHGHRDHAGLAARWQQAGAEIWAGRADAPLLALDADARQALREAAVRILVAFGVPENGRPRRPGLQAAGEQRREWLPAGTGSSPHVPAGHGRTARVESSHGSWPGPLRMTPAVPERLLDEGDVIEMGRVRLRVLTVPGHTPGSVLVERSGGTGVYTGDHLLPRMVATVGIQVEHGRRVPTMPAFIRSLARALDLAGAPAFPGHGERIADAAEAARWSLRYLERRCARIRRLQAEGPRTGWDLATSLFPHLRPEHMMAVMAEVIGLLDVMEENGGFQ